MEPSRANQSRGYQLTAALIVCPIFAVILTALRVYTRLILMKKRFGEDLSIVVAALSILLQYARISVLPSEKRICQILITALCTGYLIFIVLRMVRCIPFHALWTPGIPGARCIYNNTWFMFASQGWNMAMDFVILLSPLYILRHSNAPLRQRVLLGVVLAFGGSACIISVLRLHTLYPSGTSADPTWGKIPSAIYGAVEVNVGISCASLVTLRPLFHSLRRTSSKSNETGTFFHTAIVMPRDPACRRFGDGHWHPDMEVELGGMLHNASDSSVTWSKPEDPRR
ncbi:hypothetical protein N657DRAFT_579277 [Parathielavia appendiculata]|uniref:Rhodopsin domain-containing protein n=1 Tax=Parathielavia appendiculata TaxID=2587402 RepID=A0AAN6TTU3_9PEZI|nr:hypothetical protein N657DRAFT_579277 [Parathielavia appendiculata]